MRSAWATKTTGAVVDRRSELRWDRPAAEPAWRRRDRLLRDRGSSGGLPPSIPGSPGRRRGTRDIPGMRGGRPAPPRRTSSRIVALALGAFAPGVGALGTNGAAPSRVPTGFLARPVLQSAGEVSLRHLRTPADTAFPRLVVELIVGPPAWTLVRSKATLRPEEMSRVDVLLAVFVSLARARSLFTVLAAISSAVSSDRPCSRSPALMCLY